MEKPAEGNAELAKKVKYEQWLNRVLTLDLENTNDAMPIEDAVKELIVACMVEEPLIDSEAANPFRNTKEMEKQAKLITQW